jgi:pyruvate kinase
MNNTKIVATIGPRTNNANSLIALRNSGMSIARLNGSHNNLDWHRETIKLIQTTLPDVPILLDIPGRKIRTTQLEYEPHFNVGDVIILTTDINYVGKDKVPVNYSDLHKDLSKGQTILADDGTLKFTVEKIVEQDIYMIAETQGCLKSKKGINVPFVQLNTKLVTERDKIMLDFAKENNIDFIGLSFVESSDHVEKIKEIISPSTFPRIVSKIENQGGLNNMIEIIKSSDAIMIDRGDLSMETDLFSIALNQKEIIQTARKYAKPVIVATELLHSMIENNFPTKAEVCDITNAVLDGCAAVMLSGETAVGKFPTEAVSLMNKVVEKSEDYKRNQYIEYTTNELKSKIPFAIADAIELIVNETQIDKIIAITRSGFAAHTLSTKNLKQTILAVSDNYHSSKSFNIFPGVKGIYTEVQFSQNNLDHVIIILKELRMKNEIFDDDQILVTAVGYPQSGNRMNLIQTHKVGDLATKFNWA